MTLMMMMMMYITATEVISETTDVWRLEFTSLQPQDLGTYQCEASNDLGTAVGKITLSRESLASTLHCQCHWLCQAVRLCVVIMHNLGVYRISLALRSYRRWSNSRHYEHVSQLITLCVKKLHTSSLVIII